MSITDNQIAEIEELANDAAPFGWRPDIWMTHAQAVYACSVGPDSILALITRMREAERDAARYRWLRERGDACQWMNIIRVDIEEFVMQDNALDAAIDAAMMKDASHED